MLPEHAVVLAYPYPVFTDDRAMLWQAESGMRFSLLGGYVVRASSDSRLDKMPPLLPPAGVTSLLLDARPSAGVSGLQPASEARAADELPEFVRRYGVSAVVVDPLGHDPADVVDLFQQAYGPPDRVGPLDVWTDLNRLAKPPAANNGACPGRLPPPTAGTCLSLPNPGRPDP